MTMSRSPKNLDCPGGLLQTINYGVGPMMFNEFWKVFYIKTSQASMPCNENDVLFRRLLVRNTLSTYKF